MPMPVPHLGTLYLTVSRTLILLCKPSNATLRLSFFLHTSTFSAFQVSYKNALYKSTVYFIYINISERTLLNQHWIYSNVPKSPVYQTILNFRYFLQPLTVSLSLTTELLKIYCLSFFPAPNARYNLLPSLTFLQRCYYSRWSLHWILPTCFYLLQSHQQGSG